MINKNYNYKTYLIKPFLHLNIKRNMFKFAMKKSTTFLMLKMPLVMSYRYPSFIARGSSLHGSIRHDLSLFLHHHIKFLKNVQITDDVDLKLLRLLKEILAINIKITQHTLDILYPDKPIKMRTLLMEFPNIAIHNPKAELFATNEIVVSSVVMHHAIIKAPIFEKGKIIIYGFHYENDKKTLANEIAYKQTGQQNPDIFYNYYEKGMVKWSRYYDIKSGNYEVDCGHIVTTSSEKEFENFSEDMLRGQKSCYSKKDPVFRELSNLINNKNLTWGQRNEKFQLFLKDNLQNHPDINPSIVVYTPLNYDITQQKNTPNCTDVISDTFCYSDITTSQSTVAKSLINGGITTLEKYKQIPGHCPNIAKMLQNMIDEILIYTT